MTHPNLNNYWSLYVLCTFAIYALENFTPAYCPVKTEKATIISEMYSNIILRTNKSSHSSNSFRSETLANYTKKMMK